VLPLFAGIYRMGAGLGPAVAFLYSGPAINEKLVSSGQIPAVSQIKAWLTETLAAPA
jgi:uncharacterized membrane protein YraQ (UPF0718 family)